MKARQMRRHARKLSRNGVQPMILITSDDQLPDMIGVLIGRWLWRYRSELAPVHTAISRRSLVGSCTGHIPTGGQASSRPPW
jgi:hypothetical protein